MIYFRCYIEAYDRATTDLSALEDGTYYRLLRHYYKAEAPLPLDSDKLARICRAITLEERAAIAAVLDRFFIRQSDGWHNERADHEIHVSRTARENGSRGGRPSAETEHETGNETETATESQTEDRTDAEAKDGTGSGQPINQNNPFNLSTSQPSTQPPSARATRSGRKTPPCDTSDAWSAYSDAYAKRYGEAPVRNARVNGQLANLIRCIGKDEAPKVAAFYVGHNRATYVQAKHPTSLLIRDAEGLRTEWATNRRVSETEARQGDRTMATGNAFAKLLEEADRGGDPLTDFRRMTLG